MATMVLSRSPDGEIGVEYNEANNRVSRVYSTYNTPQTGVVTFTDGTPTVRQTIDVARPIPVPGNRRLIQTTDGPEVEGVASYQFGAL